MPAQLPPIGFSLAADAPLPIHLDLTGLGGGVLELPIAVTGLPAGATITGASFTAKLPNVADLTDSDPTTVHHAIAPSDTAAEGIRSAAAGVVTCQFQLTSVESAKLTTAHAYDVRITVLFVDATTQKKQILTGQISTLPVHSDVVPAGIQDEITYVRSTLGGDAAIKGLYSIRYGVTQAGGHVSQWDDARGAVGFGPSWTPDVGGDGPSVVGADPNTMYMRSDLNGGNNRCLRTPFTNLLNLHAGLYAVVLCSVSHPEASAFTTSDGDGQGPFRVASNTPLNGLLALTGGMADITLQGWEGRVGARVNDNTTAGYRIPFRVKSTKRRPWILGSDAVGTGHVDGDAPPHYRTTQTLAALPIDDTYQAQLGFSADETYRAVVFLDHKPSAAEEVAIQRWWMAYHWTTNVGVITVDGDSIPWGYGVGSFRLTWPALIGEEADFANYRVENFSVSGGTWLGTGNLAGDPLEPQSAHDRAPVVDTMWRVGKRNIYISPLGTNDLGGGGGVVGGGGASDVTVALLARLATARAAGVTDVLLGKLLPRDPANVPNGAAYEPLRVSYNTWLDNNHVANSFVVVDQNAAGLISPVGAPNADFYDGTHPNASGHAKLRTVWSNALRSLLGLPLLDLLVDSFGRANGLVGSPDVGPAWIADHGIWSINAGKAYVSTADTGNQQALVANIGTAAQEFEADIASFDTIHGDTLQGLYVRYADISNWLFAYCPAIGVSGPNNQLRLLKRVGGVFTTIFGPSGTAGAEFIWAFAVGDRLKIRIDAAHLCTVWVKHSADASWTEAFSTTVNDATINANTKVGLGLGTSVDTNTAPGWMFDNVNARQAV